jgi:hypothetical protein
LTALFLRVLGSGAARRHFLPASEACQSQIEIVFRVIEPVNQGFADFMQGFFQLYCGNGLGDQKSGALMTGKYILFIIVSNNLTKET